MLPLVAAVPARIPLNCVVIRVDVPLWLFEAKEDAAVPVL